MALILNYKDEEQFTTFKEAYLRIISGEFDARYVHVLVGIYASKEAREAEKNKQALEIALELCMEEVAKQQTKFNESQVKLGEASERFDLANLKFGQGLLNQEELNQEENFFNEAKETSRLDLMAYQKTLEEDKQLRDQLSVIPSIRLLRLNKFTFKRSDMSKIDFQDIYQLIKNCPEFEGSKDALEV